MCYVGRVKSLSALFLCLFLFYFSSLPAPCPAQSSDKEKVKILYQKYRQLEEAGQRRQALPYAKELVRVGEKAFGKDHSHVGLFLNNLAGLYFALGDFTKAEPLFKRALTIRQRTLGPNHPDLAQTINNLALLYYFQKTYTKAESLYKEALDIIERVYGSENPTVGTILGNMADLYEEQSDYFRAEQMYKRAVTVKEKVFGPGHPNVASSLLKLGGVRFFLGKYDEAVQVLKKALKITMRRYGPTHPEVADCFNGLGVLYRQLGRLAEAESLHKKALAIREKALGPEHPDVAVSLSNLALVYYFQGNYTEGERLCKRSLEMMKSVYGPEHPKFATSLSNLATLYHSVGNYGKAETLLKKALAIREKALGPEHPDVAISLNNLGGLYKELGEFPRAEILYKRSVAIIQKAFGKGHPHLALVLNNLGGFYLSFGRYDKAQALYQRSLEIKEKVLGPEHPDVATSINNLAIVYKSVGDYAKAADLYNRSLGISVKAFGEEHYFVSRVLSNLGNIYLTIGHYEKAELLYRRSLAIEEKVYGREHPSVAVSFNNLAELYTLLENYDRAASLYQRSLAIVKGAYGPAHPSMAIGLHNLARLYQFTGEHEKAETLLHQSQRILEKAFGLEHPHVAGSLLQQAILQAYSGAFEEAHKLFKRVQVLDYHLIDQVLGFTSSEQKIRFLILKNLSLHCFMSLVAQHLSLDRTSKIDAFNAWLRRKGLILETQKRFQEALVYTDDPEARKTLQDLSRVRTQLSRLTFAGPAKEGIHLYKKKIARLKARKERLEARLSRLSRSFVQQRKIAKGNCKNVAAALPHNTALIEFARVRMFDFKASEREQWKLAHYLTFVLHAGKGERVGMIDLGDAEKIDKGIAEFKKEIAKIRDIKGVKAIESSRKIYNIVFEPLKKELGDVKEIFISPDGNLNLIPFEVLQGPDGKFLIEDYTFNYLAAGRDLLGFGEIKGQGKKALLMGDPDFDLGAKEKDSTLRGLALSKTKEEIVKRSSDMRGLHFNRLPGTREEVTSIKAILGEDKVDLYTGKEALEEVLRQKGSPSILHLATHGFFLSDLKLSDLAGETIGRGFQQISMLPKPTGKKIKIENPLLRSGIALAGANNALKSEDAEKSDGIVTAEKILGLRLRGTDMVVLSACETGIGEVKTGEGVFGLRRAFTQAGTRSLVMSMWSVPDKETKELMIQFYRNIQSGKMNRCQAIRQAALKEMKIVKERYGHTNPLFWGGFVFMGEP